MNSLSWLIYFSNVCENISRLFTAISVITSIVLLILSIGIFIMSCDGDEEVKERASNFNIMKKYRIFIPLIIICGIIANIIPNQKTVLLIAGSQISEKVITSDKVNNFVDPIFELTKNEIMDKIKELNKK